MLDTDAPRRPQAPIPFDIRLRQLFGRQRRATRPGRGPARPLHWLWNNESRAKSAPDPIILKMKTRRLKADMHTRPREQRQS